MRNIVIAGGRGFIGSHLTESLAKLGYSVTVLSRNGQAPKGASAVVWDAERVGEWQTSVDGAFAVINLTGASISQKWTPQARAEILSSRIQSTRAIGKAIESVEHRPRTWLNGSAIGIYGNRGAEELTEAADPGPRKNFLVDTCVAWEAVVDEFDLPEVRRIKLRTGIVLGRDAGMFPPLHNLTKWFLGGHHGSGDQFISWIHVDDLVRAIIHCLEDGIEGPVNLTAPKPCDNRFFMASLRAVVGRPWSPPAPAFMLKLANLLGAPDPSLLLEGQKALPGKLEASRFRYNFPEIREALVDLVRPAPSLPLTPPSVPS